MVGYPKYLNTKADYEFVRANFPKEKWEGAFQSLLDTRCNWFNHGEINGEGIFIEFDTNNLNDWMRKHNVKKLSDYYANTYEYGFL